ncbi:MAG: TetR/AcrR family transcriptional regulator [Nakamurella sp.]
MVTERPGKRRPDDGRRAQLIEAATRVVSREGVAAATTRRIAAEAGVPHGLVHYWFSGKDELLEEVVQGILRQLEAAAGEPTAPIAEPDPADEFVQRFRSAFELIEGDDRGRQIALFELTTWSLRSPEHRDIARAQYAAYRATAESVTGPWVATHGVDLPTSPEVFAQFVSALFDGINLAWLADPDGTKPQEIFEFVGAMLATYVRDAKSSVPANSH